MVLRQITKALLLSVFFIGALLGGCRQAAAPGNVDESEAAPVAVKNIIFLIGDGMGTSHITAAMTRQPEGLHMERAKHIGFIRTRSANSYITDSAAAGTALATGKRTNNGTLGMSPEGEVFTSVLEMAAADGLATGLVATATITHATPAAFIAHQPSRNLYEAIATDFLKTDITVFIGGGLDHFAAREDSRDLTLELKEKGYQVATTMEEAAQVESGKLAALLYGGHPPKMREGRGEMLPKATEKALGLLQQNEKGFFIMIEGSQIDWAGHDNDVEYIIDETLDFDQAVGLAFDFADQHEGTLVVVTADHETGGLGLNAFDEQAGALNAGFTSKGHTGTMVPVFAYGTGAETFMGIYDNTDIFEKFVALLNLKPL